MKSIMLSLSLVTFSSSVFASSFEDISTDFQKSDSVKFVSVLEKGTGRDHVVWNNSKVQFALKVYSPYEKDGLLCKDFQLVNGKGFIVESTACKIDQSKWLVIEG
jgi:hypothetical protein